MLLTNSKNIVSVEQIYFAGTFFGSSEEDQRTRGQDLVAQEGSTC